MVLTYKQCIERYGSNYNIEHQIANGVLFRLEKGLYSLEKYNSELDVITAKYPNAIFSMDSAFYYHSLTDAIPSQYFLATRRNATRLKDRRVKQLFQEEDIFELGRSTLEYNGSQIVVYDLERMLLELIRNRSRLPFDYYKEIIIAYRKLAEKMDFGKVYDYAAYFANGDKYMDIIQMEVL